MILVYVSDIDNDAFSGMISVQKGAELLKKPYSYVMEQCLAEEGEADGIY